MPTKLDEFFSEKAHRDYMDLPKQAIKNRQLLEDVMTEFGFVGFESEWWHFDIEGWENYPILDIDFTQYDLVDVKSINRNIQVELRYATENNFTGECVYSEGFNTCYVLRCVAEKLDLVQKDLEKQGLGLKIWDGYRSPAVHKKFWDLVQDERYVSHPSEGGRHPRGTTVDLTVIRLSDGAELPMPTEFDNFTEKAHRDYMDLPRQVIKNRQLLENVMTQYGFVGLWSEWWHFDIEGWKNFPPLENVNFRDLIACAT